MISAVPRSKRERPLLLWGLAAGALGVWIAFLAFAWMNGELTGTGMRLGAELEAARKAGLPVEPSEIRQGPVTPEKDNAAPLIVRATAELRGGNEAARRALSDASYPSKQPAANWLALKPLLAQFDPVARDLHRAARLPACDFGRHYELGWDLMFPEISSMQRLTQVLTARARLASEQGRVDDAFDELDAAAHLAMLVGREPDLISWHAAAGAEARTLEGLDLVLQRVPIDQRVLNRSRQLLKIIETPPDLRNAFRSDLVMRRVSLAKIPHQDQTELNTAMWPKELSDPVLRSPTALRALEARLVAVSRRIYLELPRGPEDWKRAQSAIDKLELEESVHRGVSWSLSRPAAHMAKDSVRVYGRWIAYYRLAATAIRLIEIRMKTGKLPNSLESSDMSIDPVADEPFEYSRTADSFKVSCLAPEGADSGGRPGIASWSNGYYVAFEVPLTRLVKP